MFSSFSKLPSLDFLNKNKIYTNNNNSNQDLEPLLTPNIPKPPIALTRNTSSFSKFNVNKDVLKKYIPQQTFTKAQEKASSYSVLFKEKFFQVCNLSKKLALYIYDNSMNIVQTIHKKYQKVYIYEAIELTETNNNLNEDINALSKNIAENLNNKDLSQILKSTKDMDKCDEKKNYIQALSKICMEYIITNNPQQFIVATLIKDFRKIDAKNKYKNYNEFLRKSILNIVQNKDKNEPVLNLLLNQIQTYHIPYMLSVEVDSYGEYDKFNDHKYRVFLKKVLSDYIQSDNINAHTINKILSFIQAESENTNEFDKYISQLKSNHINNRIFIGMLEAFPHSN